MAFAATGQAEAERARALSPQPQNSVPTMALSLEQPLTVGVPTEVAEPTEPANQKVTPGQSREHDADLTLNAALVEPIDGLTIDTDTIDTDTWVSSPAR